MIGEKQLCFVFGVVHMPFVLISHLPSSALQKHLKLDPVYWRRLLRLLCMSRAWAFEDGEDIADVNVWVEQRQGSKQRLSLPVFLPSVSPIGVFLLNRMAELRVGGASS